MDFKQKAEEKKMSMSKSIARLAVTAGLTAALSFGGVMASVTMAFAEGGQGSITISQVEGNESTTFKAYQIFKATVTDKTEGKIAQNIEWANPELGSKVIKAIKDWSGYNEPSVTKLPENATAQDVADFLMDNVKGTSAGVHGTRIATDSVLYAVANAVKGEDPAGSNIAAGDVWIPDAKYGNGYYLFVTDGLDSSKPNTGTSPIFAVVGGKAVAVTEKTSIPTVGKLILASAPDDPKAANDWAGVANSQIGQEVTYKLTGSIADNYATYDSYAYKFTDTLSNGLDYVQDSLKVYAVNRDGDYTQIDSSAYNLTTPSAGNRVLTVDFAVDKTNNKKGLKDVQGVDASTQIVVFYKAKLNKNAVTGNGNGEKKGNYNSVKLEYSNNPYVEGTGTSVEGGAGDFTFRLNLNKVDQGTEKGLGNAVFTIQSADKNTKDQYVASEDYEAENVVAGQLVTFKGTDLPEYVKFTSDSDGNIAVSGLDAGSYKVTEVKTPDDKKYTKAAPFTFTITPTYDKDTMKVKTLEAKVSPEDKVRTDIAFGKLDGKAGDNVLHGQDGTGTNPTTGEVTINVGNTKSVGLPLTGLNGVTFTWIAGGAVLCIGVAHLIRSRKQAEESEQE